MSDTPRRRASDHDISYEPALVHVLDKRDEAERRLQQYVETAQRDRRRQLIGFVFFIAIVVFLFWQQREETEARAVAVAMETTERAEALAAQNSAINYRLCTEINEIKSAIVTFLGDAYMAGRDGISDGEQRILDLAGEKFRLTECPPVPSG